MTPALVWRSRQLGDALERFPLERTQMQDNRGNAVEQLGARRDGTPRCEQALAVDREAPMRGLV
jgi:hypothetical protein